MSSTRQPPGTAPRVVRRARGSGGEGAASGGRKVSVEWTSVEGEAVVLERLERALSDPSLVQEHVHVRLGAPGAAPGAGVVAAAAFRHEVHLGLEVHSTKPTLGSVELLRTSGSGALPPALAAALWSALELSYVRRVRCTDGAAQLLEFDALSRLASLRVLNLSHCGMASLPAGVGQIEVGGCCLLWAVLEHGTLCMPCVCCHTCAFVAPTLPALPPHAHITYCILHLPSARCSEPGGAAAGGQPAEDAAQGAGPPAQPAHAGGRLQ